MNWKNVLYLMRVERKSGRLLRGIKTTKYKENSFFANWPYILAIIAGIAIGLPAGYGVSFLTAEIGYNTIQTVAISLFASMPTLVLIYNLVLTLLQQIQRSGVKISAETPYWLPITWQEHTLASILASLLGLPIGSVMLMASVIIAFSVFFGLVIPALLTTLAMFASAFLASLTTEILRVLQVRFIGAVYKSSGRAAVWVRFLGSLGFFIIFYAIYFYMTSGGYQFITTITEIQSSIWYVPFAWLGITVSFLINGPILEGLILLVASALFISGLYALAIFLNKQFGLYEPPAIKVQKSGIYAPKTGFLGRLGFTNPEAALIRKDFKAFTRRRELMTVFIAPIVIILLPLMQSLGMAGGGQIPSEATLFYMGMIYLFPPAFMVMSLANLIIGEEGQSIWRIYASPISAKNLVKSKFFFAVLFGVIILLITGTIGTIIYQPSLKAIIVAYLEAFFITLALGSISLNIGFKGADFTEVPRPRMVRQSWALINLAACAIAALAVIAPLIPTVLSTFLASIMPGFQIPSIDAYYAVILSGIIAVAISAIFYRITLDTATDFLRKAEI